MRILFLISIGAADEDHQREGRGIGLTAEERATARDALAAEEAARFATPADIKKAKAQAEIEKLKRKSKKSKQAVRSRASNKNAQRNQPKNSKEPYSVDHHEEQDTNTLKRVRGIGLTEEEKAEHAAALDAEEQKRFSESQDSKEARAKVACVLFLCCCRLLEGTVLTLAHGLSIVNTNEGG